MDTKTRRAYAKINLALDITGRRADGYHDLRTVMQTVDICDTLSFSLNASGTVSLRTDSEKIPSGPDNLVVRAVELMRRTFDRKEGVHIDLTKEIPVAAGMAGGSTDAACAMHAMNELFALGLSTEELCALGKTLGADIPYCLHGGTYLAEGIGEILTPLPAPPPCTLLVVKPDVFVSTQTVYRRYDADPATDHPDTDALIRALYDGDLRALAAAVGNVLTDITAAQVPAITELIDLMRNYGAIASCMSGSGPSVFGIFEAESDAVKAYHVLKGRRTFPSLFVSRMIQG